MRIITVFCSISIFALGPSEPLTAGNEHTGLREISWAFPRPPHPGAIGTSAGPSIETFVERVTLSRLAFVRRSGLRYFELTGFIEGVGWGGTNNYALLESHYDYRLAYVLRVPLQWNGTLLVFRHGISDMAFWKGLETNLGPNSLNRVFHHSGDRILSDVALDPERRWAFFSVNHLPTGEDGLFTTFLHPGADDDNDARVDEDPTQDDDGDGLGDEDPEDGFDNDFDGLVDEDPAVDDDGDGLVNEDPGSEPVDASLDIPIGRDTTRVAQHILKLLWGRKPAITLGTGHSGGASANFMLNAGNDFVRASGRRILSGDNFVKPYDPRSGKIFDGFIWLDGETVVPGPVPVDLERGISAPTLFLVGETDLAALEAVRQVKELHDREVDVTSSSRIYMVRNVPHTYGDLWSALLPQGFDFTDFLGAPRDWVSGSGEQMKPLTAALLDALRGWVKHGTPPPTSVLNGIPVDSDGDGSPDSVGFPQSSGDISLFFPFVDDPSFDVYFDPTVGTENDLLLLDLFLEVQNALEARVDSVFLPETSCRRGSFLLSFFPGFEPFDEDAFGSRWESSAAQQRCRVETVDELISEGLYDAHVVPVDILPDRFPNTVDLSSPGELPVAILSTRGFDATSVRPRTVMLAGASAHGFTGFQHSLIRRFFEQDVNGDGRQDLVVHFSIEDLEFHPNDRVAELWGVTRDGTLFGGTDWVDLEP